MNGRAVPAVTYLAAAGTVLAVADWRTQRLPNVVVAPSYPIAAALIVLAVAAGGGSWSPLGWAAAGAVGLFAVFLTGALTVGVGMGDVKLAGIVGMYLGWAGGLGALLLGMVVTVLSAGLGAVLLLVTRRTRRGGSVPYGPFMLFGCAVGVLAWL
jgi:leader peptidase (prepilin peptidase)/N-methyltransferase